jgi:hypothetical protein
MNITEQQLFDAAIKVLAGAMANPAHGPLLTDQYAQQQILNTTMNAITQAIYQTGGSISKEMA